MAAPTITFSPAGSATKVAFISTPITVTFSAAVRNIDNSEITDVMLDTTYLTLKETNNSGAAVPFTATINAAKEVVTIIPTSDLKPNQAYYVAVLGSKFENAGNEAVAAANATWTTVTQPTATLVPTTGATGVTTLATVITVTFQEAVRYLDDEAILNADVADLITLKKTDASGADVPFTATISVDKKVITIVPSPELAANQLYYLAVNGTLVENSDEIVGLLTTSTFTTSPMVAYTGTAVAKNAIIAKALIAGDIDGSTITSLYADEKTVIILFNSGSSTRVCTIKAPVLKGVTGRIDDVTYSVPAGEIALVNVETQLYADKTGKITLDVAHAEMQIAVFYKV